MKTIGLNVNLTKTEKRKLKIKSVLIKIKRLFRAVLAWIANNILEIIAIIVSIIALLKQ